jgi:hypothetical protein
VQKRAIENLTAQQGRQCKQSAPIPSEEEERNGKKKKRKGRCGRTSATAETRAYAAVREKKAASCHCGDSLTSSHHPRRENDEEASRSHICSLSLPFLDARLLLSLSLLSVCAATARNKKTERKRRELGGATRQSGLDFCAAVWGPCDSELAMWDSVALSVDFVP